MTYFFSQTLCHYIGKVCNNQIYGGFYYQAFTCRRLHRKNVQYIYDKIDMDLKISNCRTQTYNSRSIELTAHMFYWVFSFIHIFKLYPTLACYNSSQIILVWIFLILSTLYTICIFHSCNIARPRFVQSIPTYIPFLKYRYSYINPCFLYRPSVSLWKPHMFQRG